ncbi:potassium channel activity protein [Parelaphostrongylus tenuis]|uniref:Potassium channel activity protein n=1 Tax=Parelaphostrongylus tenuis TaxID=148309 RepID=A0AAD5QHU7_PARTN|nr:potassium channel activity protein [Parelaphostrongylus tenuis]
MGSPRKVACRSVVDRIEEDPSMNCRMSTNDFNSSGRAGLRSDTSTMSHLFESLKRIYQKFKVSTWLPFVALVSYTILGAFLFKYFEMENDQRSRENYRNRTSYAMNQVVERMLEVRCHDVSLRSADKTHQIQHAKDALLWFLDHLNLTEVLHERTGDTPWTWLGSMFYAGQLYTTIGYGYPITQTVAGRVTSIFYILFGIPIFLIILKDIGRLMSRGCRKLYKRLGASQRKIAQSPQIRRVSQYFPSFHTSIAGKTGSIRRQAASDVELGTKKQSKVNAHWHAENAFPIPIALAMLILWILFSAGLFCLWEREWGYLTSVYFFFVSISTVGLGDIVFMNPDMMIFNFLLILIGLALLSMCFNLIQAALERLLDRLLVEYIEEIEKMAEIVAQEEYKDKDTAPLEFRMTGKLLNLPVQNIAKTTGFMADAKEWMAGRIANNLLASRLGLRNESDSDSEEERQRRMSEKEPSPRLEASKVCPPESPSKRASSVASKELTNGSPRLCRPFLVRGRWPFMHDRAHYETVRTLERIKPHKKDFRSILFSKFVQSDRLNRIVEDVARPELQVASTYCQTDALPDLSEQPPQSQMVTISCQTNVVSEPYERLLRRGMPSSSSVSTSSSVAAEDGSLLSVAYCDIVFDGFTDNMIISPHHSTFSVMKLEDEEPVLLSKSSRPIWSLSSKPELNFCLPMLSSIEELPSPLNTVTIPRRLSCSHLRSKSEGDDSPEGSSERPQSMYGLLLSDFDTRSISSRSTMVDSGYDKSHCEEIQKPVPEQPAPSGSEHAGTIE